jgi:hypothetical protein
MPGKTANNPVYSQGLYLVLSNICIFHVSGKINPFFGKSGKKHCRKNTGGREVHDDCRAAS